MLGVSMNMQLRALPTLIEVDVSDRELAEFTRAPSQLDIAEGALGRPDIQVRLRELISGIFLDLPPAIDAGRKLGAIERFSNHPLYCVISGMRFHELPYTPEHDVRGAFVVGLSSFWGVPSLG